MDSQTELVSSKAKRSLTKVDGLMIFLMAMARKHGKTAQPLKENMFRAGNKEMERLYGQMAIVMKVNFIEASSRDRELIDGVTEECIRVILSKI